MTANQQLYETNASTCRAVGFFLEVLIRKYNDQMLMEDYGSAYATACEVEIVSVELHELYDVQVELFFVVQEEKRQFEAAQERRRLAGLIYEYEKQKALLQH